MTPGQVAALIAAGAFAALAAVAAILVFRLHSAVVSAQAAVTDLHRATVPVLEELRSAVSSLNMELDRVDGILASVEGVSASVSNVAHLVTAATANPVIKGLAFLAGAGAAARAVRKKRSEA